MTAAERLTEARAELARAYHVIPPDRERVLAAQRDVVAALAAVEQPPPTPQRPATPAAVAPPASSRWTQAEAMAKVRKLLALSKSDNPAEAANAAGAAQAIMDRYALESAMLELAPGAETAEPAQAFDSPLNEGESTKSTWKIRLAMGICKVNGVTLYTSGAAIKIVGRPSDAGAVRYMFAYLCKEVDRQARKASAGEGRTYANNFRIGMVDTICARLKAQADETRAAQRAEAGTSIVLVNAALAKLDSRLAEAEAAMARAVPGLRRYSMSGGRCDSGARAAGQRAGHGVALSGGGRQIGNGQLRLGGRR